MRRILIVLLFACLTVTTVRAEERIQIFPLQYRSAAEILKQVEPLLDEGERASAAEKHLVLIAAPKTIEAVEKLIRVLDHPRRQFLVQVRWVDAVVSGSRGHLGYDAGSGLSTLPAKGRTFGTSQRQSGQQLRVTEGETAVVVTGRDIPYSSSWAAWSGSYGDGFASTTSFQKIRSGFSILVTGTSADQLQVEIAPQLMAAGAGSMLNPATVTLDRLATSIRIRPGDWVDLAAVLPESRVGAQILAGRENPLPAGRRLQLRIDEQ